MGNVCLGILNGFEVGLGELNVIGGNNLVTLLLSHFRYIHLYSITFIFANFY